MNSIIKLIAITSLVFSGTINLIQKNDLEHKLIGRWSYYHENNESGTYTRVDKLDPKKSGFEFKEKGKLIVRMNAGSCGAPPITYKNFNGTWKIDSDSTVILSHKFWGGTAKSKIIIKKLNDKELSFESLEDEIIRY